ncbi:hypothetical protein Rrhod_1173 [Rhodococcus rhodnii LMG 5362]|uniref:SnoaL-like domain-containing protein n=1 Tax=Rhodococcus rhodnii LMG 5362 TaxID=1273125 RepID=R7WQ99_9NOCA|nr:hypothetical protein Rrhod_1173 [Rhodococcus rhodnii LMG 5362]
MPSTSRPSGPSLPPARVTACNGIVPTPVFRLDDLTTEYARAVDRRDRDALVALFAPDARLIRPAALRGDGPDPVGAQQITDTILGSLAHLVSTRHDVGQQRIEQDGPETATGETWCAAHHFYERRGTVHDDCVHIRYADRYIRIDGRWVFAERHLDIGGGAARA